LHCLAEAAPQVPFLRRNRVTSAVARCLLKELSKTMGYVVRYTHRRLI